MSAPAKTGVPVHEFTDAEWHRITRIDLDGVLFFPIVSAEMVKRRRERS